MSDSANAWKFSKFRRHIIVGATTACVALVLGAAGYRHLYPPPPPSAETLYLEGMRALRGDGQAKDLEKAKKLFSAALLMGDARGDFGIACALYQKYPQLTSLPDGPM